MNRRKFILQTTAATAAVVAGSILYYKFSGSKPFNPLITPKVLSNFCDRETISQIGDDYLKKNAGEGTSEKLTSILLTDDKANKKVSSTNPSAITRLLNEKIHNEFLANQTLILKGWVITNTEARQCALFSLTSNAK